MDWNNLKYFMALAETGSLSRAARLHRVNHSTISRRVERLECELGVHLIERLERSYRLTPAGERMREHLKKVAAGVDATTRSARGANPSLDRVVRVSGPPTLMSRFIAPRLLPLQVGHAGLHVELVGEDRQASLTHGEADLALRLARPVEKSLVAKKLAVLAYGLYGSREHVAHRGKDEHDFLGYDESLDHLPQQRWLKKLAGGRGFALRSNDLTNLMMAARAGLGLAVLPCSMARTEPDLVRMPTSLAPLTRELWLVSHRDVSRAPAVRAVINRITEITLAARNAFLEEQPS